MKPTKIEFADYYSDNSGIEFRVAYERTVSRDDGTEEKVIIEDCSNSIKKFTDRLEWLIQRLQRIKSETDKS